MIPSDILAVLQWWFVLLIIGIGFLPLTMLLFSRFFDKGYVFAKLIGTIITAFAVFLLGIIHLVPFGQISSIVIVFLLAGLFYFILPWKWRIIYMLKQTWKVFLVEEIIFLAALFFWVYIHSFNADIHGLEKYMDYGFINSILRAKYFPPKDMWFTPDPINYYYFGHYITAFLTKLSGLPSFLTFNLMLSTVFAFCFSETFSIGANLYTFLKNNSTISKVKLFTSGLLTAILTTLAGNLHIFYAFFAPYPNEDPKPFWQLPFLPLSFPNSYWYPNATRFIYHTIHEFPIYSWTVADLHGHVLDIPFVLLIIAVLLSLFVRSDPAAEAEVTDEENKKSWLNRPFFTDFSAYFGIHLLWLVFLGFLLSIMYMTNAWDGAIYLMLASLVILYIQLQRSYGQKRVYNNSAAKVEVISSATKKKRIKNFLPKSFWTFCLKILVPIIFILVAFFIFSFPYNFFFKPFVSGIGILCAPAFLTKIGKIGPLLFEPEHCQHSYWWELLMLYGFFYFFVFSFLLFLIRSKKTLRIDVFVLLLIVLSTFLIFIPEFIYVKDIYPAHYRANTMFKLVFQSFIMLSICSGYIFVRLLNPAVKNSGILKRVVYPYIIFFPIAIVLISLVMIYPYMAVKSYYGDLKIYKGLNGISYLQTAYPTDYDAINWLNKNIQGQPVILEAQGDSYTDYARVSANTGLPTVLGWTVHEWLWRGSYSVPAPRINEVKTLYESHDIEAVKVLLKQYNVKYVIIGSLELQKYPALDEQKFTKLGRLLYQNGQTKIYQITI